MERVVIVVADNDFRELLELGLERRGFRVFAFKDATSMMVFLERNGQRIGALVVDIGFSSDDEFSVFERFAEMNPRANVIILTTDVERIRADRSKDFRMLLKPVAMDTLCTELEPRGRESGNYRKHALSAR